jgi:hypothetical protein
MPFRIQSGRYLILAVCREESYAVPEALTLPDHAHPSQNDKHFVQTYKVPDYIEAPGSSHSHFPAGYPARLQ